MDPTNLPDPSGVQTWQQVVVYVVTVGAIAVVPSFFAYLNNRTAKQARENATDAKQTAEEIKTTLTTNNGGSTVKDFHDRVEAKLDELASRLEAVESSSSKTDAQKTADADIAVPVPSGPVD